MSLNRPVVALGVLVVVALGIVGGEVAYAANQHTPAPIVSIGQGSNYVQTEPACYNDGKTIPTQDQKNCSPTAANTTGFTVDVYGTSTAFGVSDTAVADKGWFLAANGQALTPTYHTTYRRLSLGALWNSSNSANTPDTVAVEVIEGDPSSGKTYGVWNFKLHRKDS